MRTDARTSGFHRNLGGRGGDARITREDERERERERMQLRISLKSESSG